MKFAIVAIILALTLTCVLAGRLGVLALSLAIGGTGAFELYGSMRSPAPALRTLVCAIYVVLGIATICFAIMLSPAAIAYIYLVVAAFDASRRFAPRYGVAVGVFAALAVAILARGLAMLNLAGAVETWVWIAAAALAAHLSASWLKRKSGIDRFGRWLPQGGVLDRFDGLLFAAPIALMVFGR